jgi:hypothetical protein
MRLLVKIRDFETLSIEAMAIDNFLQTGLDIFMRDNLDTAKIIKESYLKTGEDQYSRTIPANNEWNELKKMVESWIPTWAGANAYCEFEVA